MVSVSTGVIAMKLKVWEIAPLFFSLKIFFFYFREREGEREHWKGREREGERESQAGSILGARNHNPGIMTCAEIKSQTLNWLSHPGTPKLNIFTRYCEILALMNQNKSRGRLQRYFSKGASLPVCMYLNR